MPRVAVLLRGVNVGGHNRVPMAKFKPLLESLGLEQVQTLLNSGNATGTLRARATHSFAAAVHTALTEQLDVTVPVIVASASQLDIIVRENPLAAPDVEPSRLFIVFAERPASLPTPDTLAPLLAADETFARGTHAAYLHCPSGVHNSKAAAALVGPAARAVTTRNWATVLKLQARLSGDEDAHDPSR